MHPIKLKNWLIAIVVLLGIGLLADYYFIHVVFNAKDQAMKAQEAQNQMTPPAQTEAPTATATAGDNFLTTLQSCLPEIAAQGIATPEALVEYFKKSIGTQSEDGNKWILKDQSEVTVERQENLVTKLNYSGHGKTLSCELQNCLCQ